MHWTAYEHYLVHLINIHSTKTSLLFTGTKTLA